MAKKNQAAAAVDFESIAANHQPKTADLNLIRNLAEEMRSIESKLALMTEEAKRLSDRFSEIQMTSLPEAMATAGMSSFELVTGDIISIKDFVRASIPTLTAISNAQGPDKVDLEERRKQAFAWLKLNKADSLIKSELSAVFGKGEGKAAAEFAKMIQKQGYAAAVEESVNFQTLNKFIKEQIAAGKDVPQEPFALFTGKKAEIKKSKSNK